MTAIFNQVTLIVLALASAVAADSYDNKQSYVGNTAAAHSNNYGHGQSSYGHGGYRTDYVVSLHPSLLNP